MTDQAQELKPCMRPVCGSTDVGIVDDGSYAEVECRVCSTYVHATSVEKAVAKWNDRAIPNTLPYPLVKEASELVGGRWYWCTKYGGEHFALQCVKEDGITGFRLDNGMNITLRSYATVRGPIPIPMPEEK